MRVALVLFVGAGCRPGVQERALLGRNGTRCLWVADLAQAQRAATMARFDAVVLDAGVVDAPWGLALLRLREALACPVAVVAGAGVVDDGDGDDPEEILALELGADVFLRQPLQPRRLHAHLGALLRRPQATKPAVPVAAPPPPDAATERLAAGLAAVALNDTQATLLQCLVAAQGRIVTRAELLAVLPPGLRARTLDLHMHRLRRRLAANGTAWPCIGAVRGRGYILTSAGNETPLALRAAA